MSFSYSAADIVISRAGALAISEMTYMGKAMILIPFPQAAENHQYINAKIIKAHNACILIEQKSLSSGKLEINIETILNNKIRLKELQKKSKTISKPKATNKIVAEIIKDIVC